MEERLQKILSQAGIASRRKAEEAIQAGRVTVNGATITELGSKADLERDHIKVDGKLLRAEAAYLHRSEQAQGCVTTMSDPEGRPTIMHVLRGVQGTRLSRGPAGLQQRGSVVNDQRWRLRASNHGAYQSHHQDLRGQGQQQAYARAGERIPGRHFAAR